MRIDPNKTSQSKRIHDLGDVLPSNQEAKKLSTRTKAALAGALTLSLAFAGPILHAGDKVVHEASHQLSKDRAFNPARGNPAKIFVPESHLDPSGVSPELQQQIKERVESLKAQAPQVVTHTYEIKDGDSPAGLVEQSVDSEDNHITDTVQYSADVQFIESQAGKDGLHPGDVITLAPGTDIPGQTTAVQPITPTS